MNNKTKRSNLFYYFLFAVLIFSLALFFAQNKFYKPLDPADTKDFFTFYDEKVSSSKIVGVKPGNEEKLLHLGDKTNRVLLYIHGFGASRAEGEFVVDSLSKKWKANTYYVRLPGHGIGKEAHAKPNFRDYLHEVEEALFHVQQLGDSVFVVGTSMGGMLATYLAANYEEKIHGLILFSPFYDYASPMGFLVKIPGFIQLYALINGNKRDYEPSENFNKRVQKGYEDYWTVHQKITALQSLESLRAFIAKNSVYKKVQDPVLMLYYYKDEKIQDQAASVKEMQKAFSHFTSNKKMQFPIDDGSHVLASQYMRTDKASIFQAISKWNNILIGPSK